MPVPHGKLEELKRSLVDAEQNVDDIQAAVNDLKDAHPEANFDDIQQKVDALDVRLMAIAGILDKPDEPIVTY